MKAVLLVALAAAVLAGTAAGGTPTKPWLWQCEQIHLEQAKDACYVRLLLLDIDRSGDPATELPRIDARAKAQPTSLYARCHMLMHVVGRQWAKRAPPDARRAPEGRAALERPRLLGRLRHGARDGARPADHRDRRQERVEDVRRAADAAAAVHVRAQPRPRAHARLPRDALPRGATRARSSARATRPTARRAHSTTTGSRCAARTRRRRRCTRSRSPRRLCAQYARYALACWYRYWIEQAPGPVILNVARPARRSAAGSPAGSAPAASRGRGRTSTTRRSRRRGSARASVPRRMRSRACAASRTRRSRASRGARSRSSASARACRRARATGCAAWFGKTFNVLENGRFLAHGCPDVAAAFRAACAAGARRWGEPLVTFS